MFELPALPYDYNALEPYIDKETMILHHNMHHKAYVDNLNKALEGNEKLLNSNIEEILSDFNIIPEGIRQAVINNGGGHTNHSFFWKIMTSPKDNPTKPDGKLKEDIDSTFGSFDKFKEEFSTKAMTIFGSGWAFLILTKDKKLVLKRHSFQNSPLSHGNIPILTIDVWEHAYYLKYHNRRADYVAAWWNIVNWPYVERLYLESLKKT